MRRGFGFQPIAGFGAEPAYRWNPTVADRIVWQEKVRKVQACSTEKRWPTTSREPGSGNAPDQGIVRDERGQEQPRDKERAQQVSRTDPVRR